MVLGSLPSCAGARNPVRMLPSSWGREPDSGLVDVLSISALLSFSWISEKYLGILSGYFVEFLNSKKINIAAAKKKSTKLLSPFSFLLDEATWRSACQMNWACCWIVGRSQLVIKKKRNPTKNLIPSPCTPPGCWFLVFSSFLIFISLPPPLSFPKRSLLLTVLSLFFECSNIWLHQAGSRLWCWYFLMPTSFEHLKKC